MSDNTQRIEDGDNEDVLPAGAEAPAEGGDTDGYSSLEEDPITEDQDDGAEAEISEAEDAFGALAMEQVESPMLARLRAAYEKLDPKKRTFAGKERTWDQVYTALRTPEALKDLPEDTVPYGVSTTGQIIFGSNSLVPKSEHGGQTYLHCRETMNAPLNGKPLPGVRMISAREYQETFQPEAPSNKHSAPTEKQFWVESGDENDPLVQAGTASYIKWTGTWPCEWKTAEANHVGKNVEAQRMAYFPVYVFDLDFKN